MVGFIGREKVLSISSAGLGAGEHEVLTMSDGRIITAYLTSPHGAITLMKLAGPNAEAVKIGEYLPGPVYGGMRDISMFENREGGSR